MAKTDLFASLWFLLTVLTGELVNYISADSSDVGGDYYNYYNQPPPDRNQYGNYIYENPGKPPDYYEASYNVISCFTCTLIVKDGHTQGLEDCNDPFDKVSIPAIDCEGACGKVYHQHGEVDFMMTRSCLPNCKEHRDDKSYTQCCSSSYCNGVQPLEVAPRSLWILSLFLTFYLWSR